MTRALRRHHSFRIKANRKDYWCGGLTGRLLGMASQTPKPCSCMMCCNPRVYADKSFSELR